MMALVPFSRLPNGGKLLAANNSYMEYTELACFLLYAWTYGATGLNTDPGCGRTRDLDMVFSSSLRLDDTMVSPGHSDLDSICSGVGHGHQNGHIWWPKPGTSSQPLVVTGAIDINRDTHQQRHRLLPGCGPRHRPW
ncbi:hypothetical protein STEG23_027479 [Scotinomys teguina]